MLENNYIAQWNESSNQISSTDILWSLECNDHPSMNLPAKSLPFECLNEEERDQAILEMILKLKENLKESGSHRLTDWESGWKENLDKVRSNGVSLQDLQPGYRHHTRFRFNGKLIRSDVSLDAEFNSLLQQAVFKKYLQPYRQIVEFGSGTGLTLLELAKLFPNRQIWGSDWAQSSVDLCSLLAKEAGANAGAFRFDYFNPSLPKEITLDRDTAILTIGSMEQIGDQHCEFLKFLLANKPGLCIHIEPIEEFYDASNLLDYLALEYHKKRKYLSGYFTAINHLAKQQQAEIIFAKRLRFGTLFHEGQSIVVWKPL